LLSLPDSRRRSLKTEEAARLAEVAKKIAAAKALLHEAKERDRKRAAERLRGLQERLFAPLSTGLFLPSGTTREKAWPLRVKEPFVGAFILSDASAGDLERLGVHVRGQAGDIFSAFIPLSVIKKLEASPAIRFIELARPLFPTLNQAVPYAQIDALHNAAPAVTGAGVIVGIIDDVLDIYHPDFQSGPNASRVLFLWDQNLIAQASSGEAPPAGITYGVEYDQVDINIELNSSNPPAVPAYLLVRHGGSVEAHGTHVAGIAAGNGRGQGGIYRGAAPGADIIFVANAAVHDQTPLTDSTFVADAFRYIFDRAAARGQPCVVNMSNSDNQGPHDGTTLGEQYLDNLLVTPGRAITLSAGNSNTTAAHAAGKVPAGGTVNLLLNYRTLDVDGDGANDLPIANDAVDIWYDGQDRFNVTVTCPTGAPIGPVVPGGVPQGTTLPNGVQVQVTSVLNDPRNGDNAISIIFMVPAGQSIPLGNTTIALTGATVVNGAFHAWVDRNNRWLSNFRAPFRQEGTLTLGVPATARRAITVGNHNKAGPPPVIHSMSGCGPTRDDRTKPEIATVGMQINAGTGGVTAPRSRNMNDAAPGALYFQNEGTSMSAPLVAGACACLFECRGATATWADLKQILEDTAVPAAPASAFGFGYMQIGTGCTVPAPAVDVWLRDDPTDTGAEPFTGPIAWLSPDIEVLSDTGNPVANPAFNPAKRFNNIIRVTVRNRGTNVARNIEAYFYWADPATNIPYPEAWNTTGIYNDAPGFVNQSNMIVIQQLAAGASTQVQFGWAPPAPGSNIRGDDHFCLLMRLEHEGDPSMIGAGGWSAITASNNIALRNIHVQPAAASAALSFYIVGTAEQDSLIIARRLTGGKLQLLLPVRALPWRDAKLIERNHGVDPLQQLEVTLAGERVRAVTGIVGAVRLEVRNRIATVTMGERDFLYVPDLRLADRARLVARVHVSRPTVRGEQRFVHVAQRSGGQLVGGVSLELRPRGR
jgi:subtilisin family serine protease